MPVEIKFLFLSLFALRFPVYRGIWNIPSTNDSLSFRCKVKL